MLLCGHSFTNIDIYLGTCVGCESEIDIFAFATVLPFVGFGEVFVPSV